MPKPMEAAMLHFVFPQYSVFRGAFNTPDFYHILPVNIRLLAGASAFMLGIILIFYKSRRFGFRKSENNGGNV